MLRQMWVSLQGRSSAFAKTSASAVQRCQLATTSPEAVEGILNALLQYARGVGYSWAEARVQALPKPVVKPVVVNGNVALLSCSGLLKHVPSCTSACSLLRRPRSYFGTRATSRIEKRRLTNEHSAISENQPSTQTCTGKQNVSR